MEVKNVYILWSVKFMNNIFLANFGIFRRLNIIMVMGVLDF